MKTRTISPRACPTDSSIGSISTRWCIIWVMISDPRAFSFTPGIIKLLNNGFLQNVVTLCIYIWLRPDHSASLTAFYMSAVQITHADTDRRLIPGVNRLVELKCCTLINHVMNFLFQLVTFESHVYWFPSCLYKYNNFCFIQHHSHEPGLILCPALVFR